MIINYFTDCACDQNGRTRLYNEVISRFSEFGPVHLQLEGIKTEFEAASCIVDAIEMGADIVMANVAPRHHENEDPEWENGTPFGWVSFDYKGKKRYVFSTIDGYTLSLLQRTLGDGKLEVNMWNIPEVAPHLPVSEEEREGIVSTQFRSLYFLPLAAAEVVKGNELPSKIWDQVPEISSCILFVDNFGNAKTSLTRDDLEGAKVGDMIRFYIKGKKVEVVFKERLKDVAVGQPALVEGSSAMKGHQFLELMINGGAAAYTLLFPDQKIKPGDRIKHIEVVK